MTQNGDGPDPRAPQLVIWGVPDQGWTGVEPSLNMRQLAFRLGLFQARCAQDRTLPRWEFGFQAIGRILTPVAREHLCKIAVELGAWGILMTDNDGLFPADLFERLVAHEQEITAPLAFTRNPPHMPVLYRVEQGFDPQHRKPYFQCKYVPRYPDNQLVEVDAVGFHAVLIQTAVLKRMTPPFFFSTTGTGEDIFFCIKAKREAQARIFVDTAIKTEHVGDPIRISEAYAREQWNTRYGLEPDRHFGSSPPFTKTPVTAAADLQRVVLGV